MAESRDEILANFQSITALDVGEAFLYLEAADWNLETAISRAIPQEDSGRWNDAAFQPPAPFGDFQVTDDDNFNNFDATSNHNNNVQDSISAPAPTSPSPDVMMSYNIPASSSSSSSSMNHRQQPSTSASRSHNNNNNNNGLSHRSSSSSAAGGSSSAARDYTFNVFHSSRSHKVRINGQQTVGDLKARIADQTGVQVCRQSLKGWPSHCKAEALIDSTRLGTMNLARDTDLHVRDLSGEGFKMPSNGEIDVVARLNATFVLNIVLEPQGQAIPLRLPGVTSYLDVKNHVYDVTSIAPRYQAWTGWPSDVTDLTTLAQTGIELEHAFTLRTSFANSTVAVDEELPVAIDDDDDFPPPRSSSRDPFGRSTHVDPNVIDVDDSEDEFEDASDDCNAEDDDLHEEISSMHRRTASTLLPDNVSDEFTGSVLFSDNYTARYGEPHPEFYQGTLAGAIANACQKPARDRKLIALYLHHDVSVLTNVFCSQLLGSGHIQEILDSNFVLYGWDLTYESNKNMLLTSVTASIGSTAYEMIRGIGSEQFPVMLVVAKLRSSCEVYSVIYGALNETELKEQLRELVVRYDEQKSVETRGEMERAEREAMLMEQDMAYNESLAADRAKAEEKRLIEKQIADERHRVESEKAEQEAKREANRLQAEQTLPPEPSDEYAGSVIKIKVRQPGGQTADRRFTPDTKLNILLNYVASIGFPKDEYKMIFGWPRRDLTTMDLESTLQDLRFCAQEQVIVEAR